MSAPSSTRSTAGAPAAPGQQRLAASPLLGAERSGRPPRGPWRLAFERLRRTKLALLGALIVAVVALLALFADAVAPYGENEIDLFNITAQPSAEHRLGTDELGRDELTRLIYGGRVSLLVGVTAALLSAAIGIVVGAVAGYRGGWVDAALMRFVDVMLAFPAIFLLLILFSIHGSSVGGVILFLGLFSWMWLARIIRGEFLSLKQRDFVEAARSIGAPGRRIVLRHLLPNVVAAIVVATTLNVAYAMLAEATLSFLGFGVPPETATWGNMLNAARPNYTTVPMLAIAPGLTLTLTVLAINFVGDGLRDALDPRR